MNAPADILRFWFGARAPGAPVDAERFALWFMKSPEADGVIRARNFGPVFGDILPEGIAAAR